MDNGAAGQPAQGQPRPQPLFRPEQMRALPDNFTPQEKQKWEAGLNSLWGAMNKNAEDTTQHQDAKRKLYEFSKTLGGKLQAIRQAAAARAGGQGQPSGPGGMNGQNPNGQPRPQPQIPKKIMDHVNTFPYHLPTSITSGSPEATKWLQEAKNTYMKGLMSMDQSTSQLGQMEALLKKRNEEGKPFTPEEEKEYASRKELAMKRHAEARNYVDNFRAKQKFAAQERASMANGQQSGTDNGNVTPVRPGMNLNQPSNPTQAVNAAIEVARNQQMAGGRPMGQNGQPMPGQNAPSQLGMPQHPGGPIQNIKQEAGIANINTQLGRNTGMNNNSPRSAIPPQSAGPQSAISQHGQPIGPPIALTHPQALQAARTYSSGQTPGTPNVMGHTHASGPRDIQNVTTNKMPIPKNLPDRAIAPPTPVQMSQSRPSYTGGANGTGMGSISQPVIQKNPNFNMEDEGNRVLSKKKLDELVRQVTGGGTEETLTPDVEESILTVADNFVDQVLQAACKNAKERGSSQLEIRDIQLTLERGYNIRIPGYASDEIRTVRKIQPSPAWISKMSAVQAAKVTGGKHLD